MSKLLLLGSVYGFLVHQLRGTIDRGFARGWRELVSYTVGVVLVFPLFLAVHKENEGGKHTHIFSYLSSFLSFGLGVTGGYFWDTVMADNKK